MPVMADLAPYRIGDGMLGAFTGGFFAWMDAHNGSRPAPETGVDVVLSRSI
jgi:hypothetical protein